MKTNAIVRIILFSIAVVILSTVLFGLISYDVFAFNHHVSVSEDGSVSTDSSTVYADPSEISDIQIEWAAGSIRILPQEGTNITIAESKVSNSKYAMQVTQSGSKLNIDYCEDAMSFIGIHNYDFDAKDLVIYVPIGWTCDTLEIDAAAAELEISDLTIRKVKFDGASGICNFTNCWLDTLDVDTASGDVTYTGTLDELEFDAMSACFYGTLENVPSRMDMDTMSGDLDISLPEDCGFRLNLDAMSSDFSSDFATTKDQDAYICGDGSCKISVSAMSGDVAIRKHTHEHNDSCYEAGSTCPDYPAFAGPTHHDEDHH